MIRATRVIFCDNEHGIGDQYYPNFRNDGEIEDAFISPRGTRQLRKDAKLEGWGRVKGHDWCPICMDMERET
jgi:hypothetical protein